MPKFSPPPSSIFKAEAPSSRTQETASHGRGPFEISFSEDEEPGSDDESDPDSYGEYSLEKRNIVPELPSQYLASSSYTDPWPLGSDRWEVSPSSYSPAPTDTSNSAIPLPLGFVPDVPTGNSPYQPPLSPLVDPQSVGDATPWIWASQPLVDDEAFEGCRKLCGHACGTCGTPPSIRRGGRGSLSSGATYHMSHYQIPIYTEMYPLGALFVNRISLQIALLAHINTKMDEYP